MKEYREIAVELIDRNPENARTQFDEVALAELADSIREHGVVQPIEVEETADGRYRIHHGERRWRAAKLAGRETIPALIAPPRSDEEDLVRGLLENLHREDLNPIDEARVYRKLVAEGWSMTRIARETGKALPTISGRLAWLEMEPEIQQLVADGRLSRHDSLAKALGSLPAEVRVPLAHKMANKSLSLKASVAAVERTAAKLVEAAKPKRPYSADSHPVPMIRHGVPGVPVNANGSSPATTRAVYDAAEAMCRACYLRPKGDYVPSWAIIEAEAAAVCEACQKRTGPALPNVCRECPGVAMVRALVGRSGS